MTYQQQISLILDTKLKNNDKCLIDNILHFLKGMCVHCLQYKIVSNHTNAICRDCIIGFRQCPDCKNYINHWWLCECNSPPISLADAENILKIASSYQSQG